MTIGESLRAYLLADASIAALVAERIYRKRLPQKVTMPAITYFKVSGVRHGNLRGVASAAEPRYQIDAWAINGDGAEALGRLVRLRLEGFVGEWPSDGGSPGNTVQVSIRFDSDMELFEEDISGGLCRNSADYFVFHQTAGGTL